MMNKQQHIDFWIRQAEDDWGAVEENISQINLLISWLKKNLQ
jgi:hypothetical protein